MIKALAQLIGLLYGFAAAALESSNKTGPRAKLACSAAQEVEKAAFHVGRLAPVLLNLGIPEFTAWLGSRTLFCAWKRLLPQPS